MYEVRSTPEFDVWLENLRDEIAKAQISNRVARLQVSGHFGDAKMIGNGIVELRVNSGPGYRLYCKRMGSVLVLLLIGGSKRSQQQDIQKAKELAKQWQV